MKKILLGAHMPIAGGFYKSAILGKEAGCTAIQIFTKSNRQWHAKPISKEDAATFKLELKKNNILYVAAHASYLINICSQNKDTEAKSTEALEIELNRCSTLGIRELVLHPGSSKDADEESIAKQAIKNINLVLNNTPSNTRLLLETMAGQGSSVGHRFEQLAKIISGVEQKDRIGICLDTCHIFAAGYDIRTEDKYENTWEAFKKLIGINKLGLIHLNDSKKELDSHVDRHDNIGQGKIGLKTFGMIMNDKSLMHIPKILETPKDSIEEDITNLRKLVGTLSNKNRNGIIETNLEKYL